MDRRQRKTREAIFAAFTELLTEKKFDSITVGEIIERADIGRATFYAHFETKDFLLKELCEELFCHIFHSVGDSDCQEKHIFDCDAPDSVFLHLFRHIKNNDNQICRLLTGQNNDLFLRHFKEGLCLLIKTQHPLYEEAKKLALPQDFWVNHIMSTFIETVRWWTEHGTKEPPETVTNYFLLAIGSQTIGKEMQ